MKLTYRGIQYEPETNPLETTEGEIGGKYRGQSWRYQYPRHIPQLQPKLGLQYRGVYYSKRPVVQSHHPSQMSIPAIAPEAKLPTPPHFATQTSETEAEQAHIESMRRNLERRLSVARENGNNQLVSMLEKEYQELAVRN
ncbi:UNVERIFIED_CONTAM: hypothetical protein BEN50_08085 [Euhalothece sp. KZN 001]